MSNGLRCLIAAMCILSTDTISSAQAAGAAPADRVAIAARIYELVQQYFAHWEGVRRRDIETGYEAYVTETRQADDRRAFDLATLRFIASLRNGHTQFIDDRADGRPLRFRLLEVHHEWVVTASQESALPRGTIVRTINGKPAGDVIRELARYVAASNERLAETHVFSYPVLFPERMSLGLKTGRTVVIDRAMTPMRAGPPTATGSEGHWLGEPRVAYIRVPSFGAPEYEQTALDFVRRFMSASSLIVDVRGNGGGATPGRLIKALMNRPWRTWQDAAGVTRPRTPSATAYQGRVFILADRFCGSACEDFVMPFKDTRRAVVIGETTQGSSGNPYRVDLGDGMRLAVGAVRYRFPDGRPFEGIGIAPTWQSIARSPTCRAGAMPRWTGPSRFPGSMPAVPAPHASCECAFLECPSRRPSGLPSIPRRADLKACATKM